MGNISNTNTSQQDLIELLGRDAEKYRKSIQR